LANSAHPMDWRSRWLATVRRIKRESLALYFALRDPRTPWATRLFLAIVVGYAFSPIDLIPDFIPVLGYVDDALLLPLAIWIALRLIPQVVLQTAREEAAIHIEEGRPVSRTAAVVILLLWGAGILLTAWWFAGIAFHP
jgi:uncharacterized membrane protein YkvA (DUF1232 family)